MQKQTCRRHDGYVSASHTSTDLSDIIVFRPDLTASTESLTGRSGKAATTGIAPYEIDDIQPSPCASPTYLHDSEVYVLHCQPSTPAFKDAENEQPGSPLHLSNFFLSSATSWQIPSCDFESHGWVEYTLPDNNIYFHHPVLCVTADMNLRDADKLGVAMMLLNKSDGEWVLPLDEWELWLRDVKMSADACFPTQAWVNHTARIVSFDRTPSVSSDIDVPEHQSQFTPLATFIPLMLFG